MWLVPLDLNFAPIYEQVLKANFQLKLLPMLAIIVNKAFNLRFYKNVKNSRQQLLKFRSQRFGFLSIFLATFWHFSEQLFSMLRQSGQA